MIKKLAMLAVILGTGVAILLWFLSAPDVLEAEELAALPQGDIANGRIMFWAGGCASCHADEKAKGDEKLMLGGGLELKSPFGVFRAPNISMDAENGIGGWSKAEFANAMLKGVAPDGSHYFPAFPYTSYSRMNGKDVADLWAFMKTLPKSANKVADHDVPFPFNIRRAVGLWKWLYFKPQPIMKIADATPEIRRGQYLVEGPGHCSECHTPRNILGGYDYSRWLAGATAPDGKGFIPNITPHKTGIAAWSFEDIVYSLESGFKPDYDTFGSTMVDVQENMAMLSKEDRAAIAAYLKKIPAVEKIAPKKKK